MHDGVADAVARFGTEHFGVALLATNLALLTLVVSYILAGAEAWHILPRAAKHLVAAYAVSIAVLAATAASYLAAYAADAAHDPVHVERLHLPSTFGPTCFVPAAASDAAALADLANASEGGGGGGGRPAHTPACSLDGDGDVQRPWLMWCAGHASR